VSEANDLNKWLCIRRIIKTNNRLAYPLTGTTGLMPPAGRANPAMYITFTFKNDYGRNAIACNPSASEHVLVSGRLEIGTALSNKLVDLFKGQCDIYRVTITSLRVRHNLSFLHNDQAHSTKTASRFLVEWSAWLAIAKSFCDVLNESDGTVFIVFYMHFLDTA